MKLLRVRAEGPDPPARRAGASEASEASLAGHPCHLTTRVRGGAAAIVTTPDESGPKALTHQVGGPELAKRARPANLGTLFHVIKRVRGGAAAIVIAPVGKRQTGGPLRAKRARPAWLVRTTALVIVTAPGSAAAGRVTLT